jgi:hypothetical protein
VQREPGHWPYYPLERYRDPDLAHQVDFMNDEGNRERLEIAVGTSLPGRRVIRV